MRAPYVVAFTDVSDHCCLATDPTARPIGLSPTGLPSTVLPDWPIPASSRARHRRCAAPADERRAHVSPRSPQRIPDGSRRGRHSATSAATPSSATPPTGSATTAGSTRCVPTAGGGLATCAGRTRATAGSCARWPAWARWRQRSARRDEAERIALFLLQLDPGGVPGRRARRRPDRACRADARRADHASPVRAGRRTQPADGARQGVRRRRRPADGARQWRRRCTTPAAHRWSSSVATRRALAALGLAGGARSLAGRGAARRDHHGARAHPRRPPWWSACDLPWLDRRRANE